MEEAKARMSYTEALGWFDFLRRRGINNTDRLIATLCVQVNRGLGGQATLADFLPQAEQHAPADDLSQVFNIIAGIAS